MKNTRLEELTVKLVSEYYKGSNDPFFQYADENILWLGPRAGQMISGRKALMSFFASESTDLSFELRGLTAYDVRTGPGRWEIILQFLVTTVFSSGEVHEHNQRMQFSWAKAGKRKKDTDAECASVPGRACEPDFTVHVLNISNIGTMEEMSLYAKSAAESKEDASFVHIPGRRGPVCIFQGMKDETYYLSADEILYLESESRARHSVIHPVDPHAPVLACKESLNMIQEKYPDVFFRSHICYLINPLYVIKTSRFQVSLQGGETLPIPEKKYTVVKEALRRRLDRKH